jgi:hypothetical protein
MASATVIAVARDAKHQFSKRLAGEVHLLAGLGVEGDAHAGATVRHRSRVAQDPTQPNLRQVHLIHAELFEELGRASWAKMSPREALTFLPCRGARGSGLGQRWCWR